ncbi:MAG: ATP-dependent helicase HrpB [Methylacidiphilales bacterium]|nr:ATP-dependent helicase HrpB [Candidatus Methylacidiphilales bacterium]
MSLNSSTLPIVSLRGDLARVLRGQDRVILQAPTGSGKSTQVPQYLLDDGLAGSGRIVVLQPRRLAARLLAKRVAEERGVSLGGEVGFQYRLENVSSRETRILYVTEGILLRQMQENPLLPGVRVLVFDEFHERHLEGDLALARARQIQQSARPDLKIVVMSATLETGLLRDYLQPVEILESPGRMFPVSLEYLPKPSEAPAWELAAEACEQVLRSGKCPEGDILIFMPGAYEIHRTLNAVRESVGARDFAFHALHGELPPAEQDAAVTPSDKRKIIVSTNVAETSLTIDGVRVVIDSGLARIARFDPHRGINTLLIEKISRASAQQRLGRAGRTAPGHGVRLWTEREHEQRAAQTLPEIRRLELSGALLTLKASGIDDLEHFPWVEAPEAKSFSRAMQLLGDLGALDHQNALTEMGRRMASFPTHPRYARMLLAAHGLGCVRAAALIAALAQSRPILLRSEGKRMDETREDVLGGEGESDCFMLMRAWQFARGRQFDPQRCRPLGIHAGSAREVAGTLDQLLRLSERAGLDVSEKAAGPEAIQRCIVTGFSDQLARRIDQGTLRCRLVHQRTGELARESVVRKSSLFVAGEIREVESRDELRVLLSQATAVEESWLRDEFPDDFSEGTQTLFDPNLRRVVTRKTRLFRDLVLDYTEQDTTDVEAAAQLLAEEVLSGRCPLKNWDDAVEQWFVRLGCLRDWMPELELPKADEETRKFIVGQICHGAFTYKAIKDAEVWPVLRDWLSPQGQRWLDQFTPERLELPGGRKAKVIYMPDKPPMTAARIQDLYGVTNLTVAKGRKPVTIQILAPNQRPVQITSDLANFWKESYPKIKQELQRRYPKHEWR